MDEEALHSGFERGAARWPGFRLSFAEFSAHIARHARPDGAREPGAEGDSDGAAPAEDWEGVYLCALCAAGNDAACRTLEQHYFAALRPIIGRVDSQQDFVDEVLQRLRVQLFTGDPPKIAGFVGRGPLERWLRTTATRIAFRHKKQQRAQPGQLELNDASVAPLPLADRLPEGEQPFRAHYSRAFEEAVRGAFLGLGARERAVLRFYFVEGMNIDDIGRVYSVNRSTVARWIVAHREFLAREVKKALQGQLGRLGGNEFDSLLGLVYDQLDVSVTALLRSTPSLAEPASPE